MTYTFSLAESVYFSPLVSCFHLVEIICIHNHKHYIASQVQKLCFYIYLSLFNHVETKIYNLHISG